MDIDRLIFSDCDGTGSASSIHVYLDYFYRGQIWHTPRGWSGRCGDMSFDGLPSRDEACEVVRMWFALGDARGQQHSQG